MRMMGRWETVLVLPLLLLCVAAAAGTTQDRAALLDGIDVDLIKTGILYDRVAPLSGIDAYDGRMQSPPIDPAHWRQIYYEVYRASLTRPVWPQIGYIREFAGREVARGTIPIAIMDFDYNRLAPGTIDLDSSAHGEAAVREITADRVLKRRVFAASALKAYTYRGTSVDFGIDPQLYFTNRPQQPSGFEMDFGDGLGFRPVGPGVRCHVSYSRPGRKYIRVTAHYDDGSVAYASIGFDVRRLDTPMPHDTLAVTASIPYLGQYATGEAYIYYGASHTSLENPVLVIEGFDLDNTMNWEELYQDLNQEGLIESLRTQGYDAVVLNFTDATDYIQRNSFAVVETIEQVNSMIPAGADLAVIGASMGGLCGRYALTYMEDQALDHNTRTFISFDSPQKGANIPLGIQYWVKLFSIESEDAAFLLGCLSTPAARQMLVYFYTDSPGMTGESDPLFDEFYADLDAIGDYPADLRKVAVANGSGQMADQGFAPGEQIILYEYESLLVDIVGNVWAVPDNTYHIVFDGLINRIWPFPDDQLVAYVDGTKPYDSAPGGYRSTMAQMDSTEAPYGDIIALHANHCFIPTISALDLDTDDLFYDIAGDPDLLAHTPFDTVYYPAVNEGHITITAESKTWFMDEIGRGSLAGTEGITAQAPDFSLEPSRPNPSSGETTIRFSVSRTEPVEIAVFDVRGRRVALLLDAAVGPGRHHTTWDGKTDDGSPISSGIYFVVLRTQGARATRPVVLIR
jgi:hypothetical protein